MSSSGPQRPGETDRRLARLFTLVLGALLTVAAVVVLLLHRFGDGLARRLRGS